MKFRKHIQVFHNQLFFSIPKAIFSLIVLSDK